MSKHFNFALDCDKGGSRALLRGEDITAENVSRLRDAYKQSDFHYQFKDKYGHSRIMSCSDPGELGWIERQIKLGARVTICRNNSIRPVIHRDP
jgi:hypothetical protein